MLAQCKGKGWRLPTVEELKKLSISFQVGYVTQHGIGFYEQVENRFTSWIEPHNSSSQLKEEQFLIMTVHPETASGVSASGIQRFEKNLRGVLRLVKSVSH